MTLVNGKVFPSDVAGGDLGFFPTEVNGSETTYYCDTGFAYEGGFVPVFGGDCGVGPHAGAFCFICDSSVGSCNGNGGARLTFCG